MSVRTWRMDSGAAAAGKEARLLSKNKCVSLLRAAMYRTLIHQNDHRQRVLANLEVACAWRVHPKHPLYPPQRLHRRAAASHAARRHHLVDTTAALPVCCADQPAVCDATSRSTAGEFTAISNNLAKHPESQSPQALQPRRVTTPARDAQGAGHGLRSEFCFPVWDLRCAFSFWFWRRSWLLVSESARRKSISGCQQRCAFSFWQLLMWSFRYEGIRIHLPHWDLVIHAILWRGSPQRRPPPCRRTARRVRGGPRDGSRARRPGASRRACPARVRARATESHQEKVSLY